jgi:hypothetical protein
MPSSNRPGPAGGKKSRTLELIELFVAPAHCWSFSSQRTARDLFLNRNPNLNRNLPSSAAEGESRDYDHDYDYERELEPGRSTEGRQGVALNVPNPIGTLEGFYRLLIR